MPPCLAKKNTSKEYKDIRNFRTRSGKMPNTITIIAIEHRKVKNTPNRYK
jgi:hypothetical protein